MAKLVVVLSFFLFILFGVARASSSTVSTESEHLSHDYSSCDDESASDNCPISLQSRNFKFYFPSIWLTNMLFDLKEQWKNRVINLDEYLFGISTVQANPSELQVHIRANTNPFALYTKRRLTLNDIIPVEDPKKYEEVSLLILRAQARALLDKPYVRLLYLLITKENVGLEALNDPFALILFYSRALELRRIK